MIIDRFAAMPLRYKMMLPTWFIVTFIMIIVGSSAITMLRHYQEQALETRVKILSKGVANTLQAALMFDDATTAQEQLAYLSFDPDIIAAKVRDVTSTRLAFIDRAPAHCTWMQQQLVCDNIAFVERSINIELGDDYLGELVVWVSLERLHLEQQHMWFWLSLLTICLSLFAWQLARTLHNLIVMPLSSLHYSMETMIKEGVKKREIPVLHNDELGRLTRCFNAMVVSLLERERQLHQALEHLESKNRYINRALDVMQKGVMVTSPSLDIMYSNPHAANQLKKYDKISNARVLLDAVFTPKATVEAIVKAIQHQTILTEVELRKSETNQRFMVSCHPLGSEEQSLIQFEDFTEQYLAEHRRKLIALMFDQHQEAMLMLSRNGDIEMQNPTSVKWFGRRAKVFEINVKGKVTPTIRILKTLLAEGSLLYHVKAQSEDEAWFPCVLQIKTLTNEHGRVEAFVLAIRDESEKIQLKKLNYQVNHDLLTGLSNRVGAMQTLQQQHDYGLSLFVVFIDLDGFKAVNDQFGHHIGDELLKVVAERMNARVGEHSLVARLAGDEFLIGVESQYNIDEILEQLLDALSTPAEIEGHHCQVSASLGVAFWSVASMESLDGIIDLADKAMYQAKRTGKNRYVLQESTVL
ncbi:diguanylate cyclase domain-containing protein [Vibrio methylphosphonaticus]|uniref:diguanylate cyclase domain-containing protein n=1 Tax=Vibrio methylphosphonaticus TaxID=2946866 RepID=UPI00202A46D1|nr:diguanylate cyclase [Vibrio methylphosphonaticus]MCL9776242.1 diguanylate cyclase [Vibrio methylphosphonaticus]